MPIFDYIAFDARGKETKGTLNAAPQNKGLTLLKKMGYQPAEVKKVGGEMADSTTTGDDMKFFSLMLNQFSEKKLRGHLCWMVLLVGGLLVSCGKENSNNSKSAGGDRGEQAHLLYKYALVTAVGGTVGGVRYEQNRSVSRSAFERAAWMGHGMAQFDFAKYHNDEDKSSAYKWYLLATKTVPSDQVFPLEPKDLTDARNDLAVLEAELSPFYKEDGQFMARSFKPAQTEEQVEQVQEKETELMSKRYDERKRIREEGEAKLKRIREEGEAKLIADQKAAVVEKAKAKMDASQERAAFFWLKKATNGEASAQLEVGLRYLSGKGVLVDTNLATHWLKAAAAQGDKKAKAELIKLDIQ